MKQPPSPDKSLYTKRDELIAFLFLMVIVMPGFAVAIVGGYGFLVWIFQ